MNAGRKTKDQAMAGAMKQAGTERTSGRCPTCNRIINVGRPQTPFAIYPHVALCQGRSSREGQRGI